MVLIVCSRHSPSFSLACLVTPSCLWGASVGVRPWKGACVLQGPLLIFVHVFSAVFSWCFEGIFSQPFLGVVHLNLIALLRFELDQLPLLLSFELDYLLLLLNLEPNHL